MRVTTLLARERGPEDPPPPDLEDRAQDLTAPPPLILRRIALPDAQRQAGGDALTSLVIAIILGIAASALLLTSWGQTLLFYLTRQPAPGALQDLACIYGLLLCAATFIVGTIVSAIGGYRARQRTARPKARRDIPDARWLQVYSCERDQIIFVPRAGWSIALRAVPLHVEPGEGGA